MRAPYSRTRTQSEREKRTGQEQDVGETTRNSCSLFDGKTEEINLRYTTRRQMVSILLITVCLLLERFESRLINYHFQNSSWTLHKHVESSRRSRSLKGWFNPFSFYIYIQNFHKT